MSATVELHAVSLRFRIYRNVSPSLKDTVVNLLTGKRELDQSSDFYALRDITLELKPGERVGLIGLNGAGKSTLLKTITGIYQPHEGRMMVRGKITPLMELGAGFDPEQSGRRNIFLNGALLGFSPAQMKAKVPGIVEFSELGEHLDLPVKYFSSGMHQRLAFSIASATDPDILLIDEVFAAGDGHFVEKSSRRIDEMVQRSTILILVSHDMQQIRRLSNRVIYLEQGRIAADGEPEAVITAYENRLRELNRAH